jgi:hypothetical protein
MTQNPIKVYCAGGKKFFSTFFVFFSETDFFFRFSFVSFRFFYFQIFSVPFRSVSEKNTVNTVSFRYVFLPLIQICYIVNRK